MRARRVVGRNGGTRSRDQQTTAVTMIACFTLRERVDDSSLCSISGTWPAVLPQGAEPLRAVGRHPDKKISCLTGYQCPRTIERALELNRGRAPSREISDQGNVAPGS